ncbi:VOC family protein [Actinophytocola sp.]|uniref:VOC family protein n=1 Tax=Actinophytocola sp. TaxID=1872138 RepID=UPI002D808B3E|nr:VOC family protein [Actinophytocola sp.]HET9141542.1 VOC family protein [Actinophytocola sp.]
MAHRIDLTLDCADAPKLAEFWKLALGYIDEPPPAPYRTRQEWLAQFDLPDDDGGGAWLCDPEGRGPRLSLIDVPEPKVVKNRMHIDIRVAGEGTSEERWARITGHAELLTAAGATVLWVTDGHHVTMADPEGNEFDVC